MLIDFFNTLIEFNNSLLIRLSENDKKEYNKYNQYIISRKQKYISSSYGFMNMFDPNQLKKTINKILNMLSYALVTNVKLRKTLNIITHKQKKEIKSVINIIKPVVPVVTLHRPAVVHRINIPAGIGGPRAAPPANANVRPPVRPPGPPPAVVRRYHIVPPPPGIGRPPANARPAAVAQPPDGANAPAGAADIGGPPAAPPANANARPQLPGNARPDGDNAPAGAADIGGPPLPPAAPPQLPGNARPGAPQPPAGAQPPANANARPPGAPRPPQLFGNARPQPPPLPGNPRPPAAALPAAAPPADAAAALPAAAPRGLPDGFELELQQRRNNLQPVDARALPPTPPATPRGLGGLLQAGFARMGLRQAVAESSSSGGGYDKYFDKYLKYKAKYIQLRKQLN